MGECSDLCRTRSEQRLPTRVHCGKLEKIKIKKKENWRREEWELPFLETLLITLINEKRSKREMRGLWNFWKWDFFAYRHCQGNVFRPVFLTAPRTGTLRHCHDRQQETTFT